MSFAKTLKSHVNVPLVTYLLQENDKVHARQGQVRTSEFILKAENKRKVELDREGQKVRLFGSRRSGRRAGAPSVLFGTLLRGACRPDFTGQHLPLLARWFSL